MYLYSGFNNYLEELTVLLLSSHRKPSCVSALVRVGSPLMSFLSARI
jgi:hypothetical protein